MPGAFCQYIHLDHSNFLPISTSPMKVLLSVSWNQTTNNNSTIEASASWSENVTVHGFKACVLVAGRHFSSDFKIPPSIHWTAHNFNADYLRRFGIESGVAKFPKWYTGTMCQNITLNNRWFPHHRVIVSISHSKAKNYRNAMTAWSDLTTSFSTRLKICARELQNFDGVHDGVLVVSHIIIITRHSLH